jgi:hypothetical protein
MVRLLYEDVLMDAEVRALVPDMNGRHVLGHILWTRQVEPLFVTIGSDQPNSVVKNVQQQLPEVLQVNIATCFANYSEFLATIRRVDTKSIQQYRKNMETVLSQFFARSSKPLNP